MVSVVRRWRSDEARGGGRRLAMREAKNMELVKVQTYESTVLKAVHTKPNLTSLRVAL